MSIWTFSRSFILIVAAVGISSSLAPNADASETSSTAWSLPPIHVVDDAGTPLTTAEAVMVRDDDPRIGFYLERTDKNGDVKFSRDDYFFPTVKQVPEGTYDVMVRAPGFAPAFAKWNQPTSSPLTVTVKRGKAIELTLKSADGRKVPEDLSPVIYPQRYGLYVQPKGDEDYTAQSVWPERSGNGKYRVVLNESTTQPLNLMVQDPEFLTGFLTTLETTSALQNGRADIVLPKPGIVEVKVAVPDNLTSSARDLNLRISVQKLIVLDEETRLYVGVAGNKSELGGKTFSSTMDNLVPGNYYVSVNQASGDELMKGPATRLPQYRDGERVEVATDAPAQVNFTFKQFDPDKLKGDGVAHVTVKKQDGSPAAGLAVRLRTYLPDFGSYYTITTGTLDAQGEISLSGLGTVDQNTRAFDLTKDEDYSETIGSIALKSGATSRTYEFIIPPAEGDIAPDITLYDVNTSAPVKLSSLRGKVVFLDFWATWCGPCQVPMAHNQKVLEENGARWGDNVAIIGASIDEDAKTVVDHVKKNGWEAVRHLWCGDGAFKAKPGKTYGITGVPTAFLIDQQGKILWRGHPSGYELVTEVDKLLAEK